MTKCFLHILMYYFNNFNLFDIQSISHNQHFQQTGPVSIINKGLRLQAKEQATINFNPLTTRTIKK